MEEEEDNKLAVLDLGCNVNRKLKKLEFEVHYKKTNTNITIKKKSNHKDNIKKGIIKGFGDRARRALCYPQYLEAELENVEAVFVENGYTRKEVQAAIQEKEQRTDNNEEEQTTRGVVLMPNISQFTNRFNKIARRHRFRVANKADNKVRDLTSNAKTPLGKKNTNVTYTIPCKCNKYSYNGETKQMWGTREKERLTLEDIQRGNVESARNRMNAGDGGLAKHGVECQEGINWNAAKITGRESGTMQRKMLEGVESLKEKYRGRMPLNSYNQMEQWQSTIYSFLGKT